MIKLFGWEPQMNDRITEKREEELKYIFKDEVLFLSTWIIKYAFLVDSSQSLSLIEMNSVIIPLLTMVTTFATYVSPTSY
jgi:hypothetical protein